MILYEYGLFGLSSTDIPVIIVPLGPANTKSIEFSLHRPGFASHIIAPFSLLRLTERIVFSNLMDLHGFSNGIDSTLIHSEVNTFFRTPVVIFIDNQL